jgi:hypothetical protein
MALTTSSGTVQQPFAFRRICDLNLRLDDKDSHFLLLGSSNLLDDADRLISEHDHIRVTLVDDFKQCLPL